MKQLAIAIVVAALLLSVAVIWASAQDPAPAQVTVESERTCSPDAAYCYNG